MLYRMSVVGMHGFSCGTRILVGRRLPACGAFDLLVKSCWLVNDLLDGPLVPPYGVFE